MKIVKLPVVVVGHLIWKIVTVQTEMIFSSTVLDSLILVVRVH
jgi:hypothetical protein